jgi:hypothetical protein
MTQSVETLSNPQDTAPVEAPLAERRQSRSDNEFAGGERRQFSSSYDELTPDGRELAEAIDQYKMQHRRRYITHDETLEVFRSLGYHR